MMIAHYTAAALVAENRRLSHPASVDSMSTSANQEDHVSLGWAAARNLRQVLTNLSRILAVEAVCAAQAIDLREPLLPAAGTAAAIEQLRVTIPGPGPDRFLGPDLTSAEALVWNGELLGAVEAVVGSLA
jgi:histidine ammonia-lyase